jgi:cold-inducible RNA-binding protein
MFCQELDQLEWDFIQAREGSLDIDSLGWTNREFSCLDAILDHKREGIRANAAPDNLIEATMKNIFVGNLAFNTSEEDVRRLFAAYGQVDRVTIVRDRETDGPRGFGFVEMASSEEGNKAIAALNGTLLGDRALNVNDARPRPGRTGGGREGRERRGSGGRW